MRLASYNIEWFSNLFDDDNNLNVDHQPSGRYEVSRADQTGAIAHVLKALDADAVMVIEAPDQSRRRDTVAALEHFADVLELRTSKAVMGFRNDTQQEIALLYDPKRLTAEHDPLGDIYDAQAPRFDGQFRIDLDIDATRDVVRFSKPPLELSVTTAEGRRLRLIGAHLKSKAPHGATTRDAIMRQSIANRRKQLAQAIWLRARIDGHLSAGDTLIVMGDLNDGPGLDEYEHLFGRSSVEIVMGDPGGAGSLYDPHAHRALQRKLGANPTTARFFIEQENRFLQALLDYIMVSPDLMSARPCWRIWHPFDDPECWTTPALREALLMASDHFPVTLDIELRG
ncbi:endonuclease/exonuclease/phosphatase family protein [Aestuariivita sp.]|jgi:endonuclease/exonuclease/phosphatase family metal-dependent hydrolase|uniref:endonuclease/exonuclease/phosphatase family protein n=1 Tax=Aestuariivita sp. TaxID=1872407 RepID=UPI002174170B|nr:endonuclease/exonuclease/phosphatase family protein [Aestuariivita sp.]MCE8006216.1 endonuclease [Aestuariivita sp.]